MIMEIISEQLNLRDRLRRSIRGIEMTWEQYYTKVSTLPQPMRNIPKVIYPISPFVLFLDFEISGISLISKGGSRFENKTCGAFCRVGRFLASTNSRKNTSPKI
jgi:hypothetical protein